MRGRIIETREAEDGTSRSFIVKTESGSTTLRNARFIRHQTKKKGVSWTDGGQETDDAAARGSVTSLDGSGGSGTDIATELRRSERLAGRENWF